MVGHGRWPRQLGVYPLGSDSPASGQPLGAMPVQDQGKLIGVVDIVVGLATGSRVRRSLLQRPSGSPAISQRSVGEGRDAGGSFVVRTKKNTAFVTDLSDGNRGVQ